MSEERISIPLRTRDGRTFFTIGGVDEMVFCDEAWIERTHGTHTVRDRYYARDAGGTQHLIMQSINSVGYAVVGEEEEEMSYADIRTAVDLTEAEDERYEVRVEGEIAALTSLIAEARALLVDSGGAGWESRVEVWLASADAVVD